MLYYVTLETIVILILQVHVASASVHDDLQRPPNLTISTFIFGFILKIIRNSHINMYKHP